MIQLQARQGVVAGACLLMTGCGHAPSIDVLGSFFPVWMLCLTLTVPLTFAVSLLQSPAVPGMQSPKATRVAVLVMILPASPGVVSGR